ncbi:helix-turn-helix domain-containing protein [Streptomyces tauricus]|uniref:helix-turn-helix domain-containing protein n=1 Tax=Streptomyces tauricus TaxID=68274 RepID=UPI0022445EFF|nr:helix-turn-helix transcriptional regulator [Streptomyces tauricus]MCW8102208.1 helix-turn-helix domain-containing protein [Streptomyces tauricus]
MPDQPQDFGQELRRRRMAARWSLEQLGQRVHYSKGQLSKVERGLKRPTPELARLCDTQLKADGALAELVPVVRSRPPLARPVHDDEVWLMQLGKDGSSSFRPVTRRGVMAAGAASVLTMRAGDPPPQSSVEDVEESAETVVDASRLMFDQFRRFGQASGPAGVLPPLIAQTHSLEQLALRTGPRTRRSLLVLASRYAEYAGWMAQEGGDDAAALWWTERAVQLANAGQDTGLAMYAHVRGSLISLYRGDVTQAVQLATRALESTAPPRVRGLAAQHLAQSKAVEGDYDACMRSLDRARELLARDAADPGQPVLGASHVPDVVSMFTGWCLYDLGRPGQAAESLDIEIRRIPEHALRTRARYGVRRALAHAAAGDVDQACEVASGLLPSVRLIRSATVRADLRRLSHTLGRHARHASVRALTPELTSALTLHTAS